MKNEQEIGIRIWEKHFGRHQFEFLIEPLLMECYLKIQHKRLPPLPWYMNFEVQKYKRLSTQSLCVNSMIKLHISLIFIAVHSQLLEVGVDKKFKIHTKNAYFYRI